MFALFYVSLFLFIVLCVFLSFVILIQENKNMGLGASFGGDASSSLFGTSTALVVKKTTAWLAAIFFFSCIFLSAWSGSLAPPVVETPTMIEGS